MNDEIISSEEEQLTSTPVIKVGKSGKKKNKKSGKNKSAAPSNASVSPQDEAVQVTVPEGVESLPEEPQQPLLYLPVRPDEWLIVPQQVDGAEEGVTEDYFVFLKEGIEVISLPYTEDNFSGLLTVLSQNFISDETIPDTWTINTPLSADPDADPVMSLSRNGRLLAATTLDQDALKRMVKALNSHIIKPPMLSKTVSEWWMKHKVLRIFASAALLPVLIAIIAALVWGIQN
jgi:hypothetical protein